MQSVPPSGANSPTYNHACSLSTTTIGLKLIWDRSEDTTLDFSIDMIDRDDGLDQFVLSFGWNKSF